MTTMTRPLALKPRPVPVAVVSVVPEGPPIRFRWGKDDHVVRQSWGPERIETGWWDGGPTPGEKGASVILGHNIGNGHSSVFENLGTLKPGDRAEVTRADGSVATFEVTKLEQIAKSSFPTQKVYGKLSYPGIRLITCGGRFDASWGHHVDNIIVYGKLVSGT